MATEVVMPQMGESIAEGTITKWLKNVGDKVERDEPLFEISTDKVDAEIPAPAAGTLTEIKHKEGETVEVNTVVAVLDGDGAQPAAAPPAAAEQATPVTETAAAQEPEAPAPAESTVPAAPPPPAPPQIERPKPTITTSERGAPPAPGKTEVKPLHRRDAPAAPRGEDGSNAAEDLRRTKSSPLVRKIAEEHGIDIAQLEGTGMSGRVTKNDILSFIESGSPVPARPASQPAAASSQVAAQPSVGAPGTQQVAVLKPVEGDRVEQMSVMRKKISDHMVMSRRTSAHVTTVYEIDMTRVAKLRDENRKAFQERTGTKLTFMPFIFKAVTDGIRKFPIFNAQVSGDQIIYKRDINLGMAVALDGGLIVPVIKRADDLSISGLARAANDLADRARTKQLKPDEVAGGTFTITNPGVFGGLFGTPIINQPQVAILGVGKIEKRAKVLTTPDGEDYIAIRHMAYFALSFDHRIIDGADAEKFLAYIKEHLETAQFAI
ncbi:MAG TPA: 2-oxoglutarate dehydrogenase, E2 component, dihydrolipoamide succinyltransferase [Pyrinomonadaceae bacterium]|nr:2-oxoglutarate dehydrogenase, E2 component, dihydrolipoamide succinyltransferase [Pyrinomonadaceae bacterium]